MAANPDPPQSMGSTNAVFNTETRFDTSYVKTLPGIIKVAVIVLNLLGFICIMSSPFWWHGRGVYFNIVAQFALWYSLGLLMLYLFHVVERYHRARWLHVELIACGALSALYLVAATIAVAYGNAGYSAAGFFGYLAMVVYGFDAFLKAKAIKAGELAQGTRVHTKQTHVVTPPALP